MTPTLLAALLAARHRGRELVLATHLGDGRQHLLPDTAAPAELGPAAADILASGAGAVRRLADGEWFLDPIVPAPRLLLIGAVHIASVLTIMAAAAGYAVHIIEPRAALARQDRFADATLIDAWPDAAIAALAPDRSTAIIALAHDPKLDDPGLGAALRSDAFYIGALGSRRSHAARLARLAQAGHDPASLGRIRGPVGLPIGGRGAAEIAVSILGDLIAVRRGAPIADRP